LEAERSAIDEAEFAERLAGGTNRRLFAGKRLDEVVVQVPLRKGNADIQ
jgi:hypothetical protein